jgi:hypothetical protein
LEELQEKDWKKTLNLEFQSALTSQVQRNTQEEDRGFNPKLVSAFYTRMRWDLAVKDVKRIELAEMTRIPVHGSKLYKIILAGRRYIGNVCKELQGGNMLLRRSLMNSEYISLKGFLIYTEMKLKEMFFQLYKRNLVRMHMELLLNFLYAFI